MRTIIAIPSYGRATNIASGSRFCTARWISRSYWPCVRYYVEPEQVSQYRAALSGKGATLMTASRADVPKKWGSIMDLIIDECCAACDHLVIMDDDLAMAVRPNLPSKPTSFEPMTEEWFDVMMDELRNLTTAQVPLTSTQYRQFCQGKSAQYQHNQRVSMIWSLNAKFFRTNTQFRFYRGSELDFMSDYYFFLNLLVHGHQNVCVNRFTKDDVPNANGGEKEKRKQEVFNAAVKRFAAMFPQYVTVRVKVGKGNWADGMMGVTIAAAKAYKDGCKRRISCLT